MNKISMAIHAFFFISGPGIDHGSMGQHGATFIRNVQNTSMAFLALFIFKRVVGRLAIFFVIIIVLGKVDDNIFDPVKGFGIEEINGVAGRWQMAVHTVRHESLGIIYVSGCLPGVVGKLNLVAGGAKTGRGSTHHGVVGYTENRKSHNDADKDVYRRLDHLSPMGYFIHKSALGPLLAHIPSSASCFTGLGESPNFGVSFEFLISGEVLSNTHSALPQ
jgi:hypothetical protein